MKYFNGISNLQELRDRFRKLAKEHHPDRGGDTATMQEINAEYETAFKYVVNHSEFSEGRINYETELDPILRQKIQILINIENLFIEVCGNWLWITGNTKEYKDLLKERDFKFSAKKLAWYWHAGDYKKRSKRKLTLDEIRDLYGSTRVKKDSEENVLQLS